MIKRAEELQREVRKEMLGGQGEVTLVHLLQGEEFQGKGRLFSRNIIEPGCSVGFHQHNGDGLYPIHQYRSAHDCHHAPNPPTV